MGRACSSLSFFSLSPKEPSLPDTLTSKSLSGITLRALSGSYFVLKRHSKFGPQIYTYYHGNHLLHILAIGKCLSAVVVDFWCVCLVHGLRNDLSLGLGSATCQA